MLHTASDEQTLLLWILRNFALFQMRYVMQVWIPGAKTVPLAQPMLCATAVNVSMVEGFAPWADLSTPATGARKAAVGVAVTGWVATSLSMALSIDWQSADPALDTHLNRIATVAMVSSIAAMMIILVTHLNQAARS